MIGLGGAYLAARSLEDGVATVHRALDLGITYFDTSPMYCHGASQAVLGEALKGKKEGYLMATKLGYFRDASRFHSPEALITQFEENLRLLRRSQVDTLQIHEADFHHWWSTDASRTGRLNPSETYDFENAVVLRTLRQLKQEGRCRFLGISGNSANEMKRVLEHVEVDTFLLAFNYDLVRRGARAILPIARARNCVTMVGAIFAQGLAVAQPELLESPPDWMTAELLGAYREIARLQKASGLSLATLGVRYMVSQPEVDVVIIGARTPREIEECAQAADAGALPDDLLQEIEAIGV